MRKWIIVIVSLLFLVSCKSILTGDEFRFVNDEKFISVVFLNDSIAEIRQEFYCDKVPENLRKSKILTFYSFEKIKPTKVVDLQKDKYGGGTGKNLKYMNIKFNVLIMNNIDCENNNCDNIEPYTVIPDYIENCIDKSEVDTRILQKMKFVRIHNMVNDTLFKYKNYLIFNSLRLDRVKVKPR
ncbi:MAG: hypothetical protein CO119_06385 [Flavobacteriales bacterium CG_4_9_14_3_um_filter_40_17]|nr:MAG: hypothetical protein CO119_06385 [Flavobacteriales bacterium CG_4_9_14_3_um_filter_40_17]